MLERIPDGTPARMLVAAQNYVQEIELIEGAMRRAASPTAAKRTDRDSFAAEPLGVAATLVAFVQSTAEPTPEPTPEPEPEPTPEPEPEQPTPDGEGDESDVTVRTEQAAAVASVGEDDDASIAERLREKEVAAMKEGASAPEAAAGARCGVEVGVLDDEGEKLEGLYEVNPLMPEEMSYGETEQVGLLVSPVTRQRFREINEKHGVIAEASKSNIGCVELADQMKAQLVPVDRLDIDRHQLDDVRDLSSTRSTRWGWEITASQTGEQELILDLSYSISREGQEFRRVSESPVYDGAIRVTVRQSDSTQNATEQEAAEQPWWRRIFGGILERIFGVVGA
jgi:hypothetical protein